MTGGAFPISVPLESERVAASESPIGQAAEVIATAAAATAAIVKAPGPRPVHRLSRVGPNITSSAEVRWRALATLIWLDCHSWTHRAPIWFPFLRPCHGGARGPALLASQS